MPDSSLARWKRAVVHLEGAATTHSHYEDFNFMVEQSAKLRAGEITVEEFRALPRPPSWDKRFQGTAVYLTHEGRPYLVTAQHVLHDAIEAKHILAEAERRLTGEQPPWWEEQERAAARERAEEATYSVMFRVRSFDERLQGLSGRGAILQNLGSPNPKNPGDCIFSARELDLAVISLQNGTLQFRQFAEDLEAHGYTPITLDDVADEPSGEGADVFTVGYPISVSVVEVIDTQHRQHWASDYISLPCVAYGRVSMLHARLPFFWCDMSVYPGNSGGPLIEGDKLVGLVSAQATTHVEEHLDDGSVAATEFRTGMPFGMFIKGSHVRELVLRQAAHDAINAIHRARMRRPATVESSRPST